MLNGTVENDLPPDVRKNIKKTLADSDRGRLATLTLNAIPEYNGTTVQCVAFENGNLEQSETVTMTIQGNLYWHKGKTHGKVKMEVHSQKSSFSNTSYS